MQMLHKLCWVFSTWSKWPVCLIKIFVAQWTSNCFQCSQSFLHFAVVHVKVHLHSFSQWLPIFSDSPLFSLSSICSDSYLLLMIGLFYYYMPAWSLRESATDLFSVTFTEAIGVRVQSTDWPTITARNEKCSVRILVPISTFCLIQQ